VRQQVGQALDHRAFAFKGDGTVLTLLFESTLIAILARTTSSAVSALQEHDFSGQAPIQ
jgi:hypothetical protein